ncbi:MAG: sulfurtransferase TusA family protein [Nitrososphaerales archaeon]
MATVTQKIIVGASELAGLNSTRKIDTRGLVCPFPAFETAKLIGSSDPQDVLEILTNDRYTAESSIPSVLRHMGYDSVVMENDDGTLSVKARKH